MDVFTRRFGDISVQDDDIFELPRGLVGFEGLRRWTLLTVGPNASLMWLQSLEDPDIAFPVAYPEEFHPEFICELSDENAELLGLDAGDPPGQAPVHLLALCAVSDQVEDSTIDLRAPVVINTDTMQGAQLINQAAGEQDLRAPLWEHVPAVRLQRRLQQVAAHPAELVEPARFTSGDGDPVGGSRRDAVLAGV